METLIDEFYKAFNIEPIIKEGQAFMTTDCRVAMCIATEDKWPEFNIQRAWEIENYLLEQTDYAEVHIIRENNNYGYLTMEGINEDYGHHFTDKVTHGRLEALIAYCIEYAHVKDFYDKVREIFGQNDLKGDVVDMSSNMTNASIERIETTWSPLTPTEYKPIDWNEYEEQES